MQEQDFYIGQVFMGTYPTEAADWCCHNNAYIDEIEPGEYGRQFEIKEVPEPTPPTYEEQKENRAAAYQSEVDPITSHIGRLRDEEQTEEIVAKINELIAERAAKVEEIKARYPYPVEE